MLRHLRRPLLEASKTLSKMVLEGQQLIIPKGRTFSLQYSLPHLPVPALEQTLKKYLDTCRPLLTDEEYNNTVQVVAQFKNKEAPALQKLLEAKAQNEINWLSGWWKTWAYLDVRVPVVINVSPGIFMPRQTYRGQQEQIEFAAKFISGILDYKTKLDAQTIPVETLGGKPLCMAQYYQLLNACRIPGTTTDSHVVVGPNDPNQPKHMTIIVNNQLFSVPVFNDQGRSLSAAQLSQQLNSCVNQSRNPGVPIGVLTTMERTSWGEVYSELIKDPTNKRSLESIQTSICVICLDGPRPGGEGDPVDSAASIILHGGGSRAYSSNRWYDKTLQFIFSPDGFVGLNYEHTTAEGPAVIGLLDHVLDYVGRSQEQGDTTPNIKSPQLLPFNISGRTQEAINKGTRENDLAVNDLMLRGLFFKDYGKNFIKQQKLSPDAFIQVAFQLAFYRTHKEPCATYETGSLRRFQLGRTDTIRSCSIASLAFTKAMDDPSVPGAKKVELLRKAIQSHRQYIDDTINGQGIDRHLLGLKLLALENGHNPPQIFQDQAFKRSTHYRLSTSQVVSKYTSLLCFGPVVPDGYGLCYNPQDDELIFSISSFNSCPQTNSETFSASLSGCFRDLHNLLSSTPQAKL